MLRPHPKELALALLSMSSSGETQLKLGHHWCCVCLKYPAVPAAQSPHLRSAMRTKKEQNPVIPILQRKNGSSEAGFLKSAADGEAKFAKVKEKGCSHQVLILNRSLHTACTPHLVCQEELTSGLCISTFRPTLT